MALNAPNSVRGTSTTTDAYLFHLLSLLWGVAALFHIEYQALLTRDAPAAHLVTAGLVTVAALATCWKPTLDRFAALAAAQVADVCILLPDVPNHWLLAGLVNVGWLIGWARASTPEQLIRRARAPLMVAVALFYLWTGVWKLNADFVRPEVSCAVMSWERVVATARWMPNAETLPRGIIAATLLVELVGPFLLLLPATRGLAVVTFLGFHLLLGLDVRRVHLNFSSVMFPLIVLFLPDTAIARLERLVPGRALRGVGRAAGAYLVLVAVAVTASPLAPMFLLGRWLLWLCSASVLCVLIAVAVAGASRPHTWLPADRQPSLVWIVPALVVLNGLTPIFGLKTRTAWQMYSNARIEPDASNHFLFGRSMDVMGALRDPVSVVASESPSLRDVAGTDMTLPWIEFRRRLLAQPAATTWRRGGESHVTTGPDDPALGAPPSVLVRKLMTFRPLGPQAAARCDW
jgi:hypothetical protein